MLASASFPFEAPIPNFVIWGFFRLCPIVHIHHMAEIQTVLKYCIYMYYSISHTGEE